jgi:hypothetical protein
MHLATFATVFSSRTQSEADLVIGLLRSSGLHPLDLFTSPHFSIAGVDAGYRVEVPQQELETAREIIAAGEVG